MLVKLRRLIYGLWDKYKQLPIPVKASLWFIACSVLQKGISLFTTPIFTRLMTTEQYGQFTLYSSWLNIIAIFVTLNLQYGTFNTAQVKFGDDRKAYTSSIQGLVTCIFLLVLAVFCVFGNVLENLLDMPKLIIGLMLVNIWGQFSINLWLSNRRFDYKYKSMIAVTIGLSVVGIGLGLMLVLNTQEKGYARIYATVITECVFGLSIFLYNMFQGKHFFVAKYWKFALGFNIPLIPYYLSQVVFNQSDRIMISSLAGVDKAGIYGLAHNIAFLLTFVINAIRNAYTPRFFQMIKSGESKKAKTASSRIILAIAVMLALFIFVGPELLWIMGGQEYYGAIWIIPPLVAGILFEYFTDFSVNVLFYYEKKWMLVLSTIGCALVNIVLNYFGILMFGYQATAYTTLIAYILFWLFLDLSARSVCKKYQMDADGFLCSRQQAILGTSFLAVMAISLLLYLNNYIRYCVLALVILALLVFHKKVITAVKAVLASGK